MPSNLNDYYGLISADRVDLVSISLIFILPIVIFSIGVFDVVFVTITRFINGKKIYIGGKDHTSHRLVAIGFSENSVVLMMVILSIFSGALAYLLMLNPNIVSLYVAFFAFIFFFTILGVYIYNHSKVN